MALTRRHQDFRVIGEIYESRLAMTLRLWSSSLLSLCDLFRLCRVGDGLRLRDTEDFDLDLEEDLRRK